MAEPAGIIIEFTGDSKAVNALLNTGFEQPEQAGLGKKVGYFLSHLLYQCHLDPRDVFIFNYDAKTQKCFIAYFQHHFSAEDILPLVAILESIRKVKITGDTDMAIVTTSYPEVLSYYQIKMDKVVQREPKKTIDSQVSYLLSKFWSFSSNHQFPDPEKALNKRQYFYKNFKNYYKKYLIQIEQIEKPKKIAQASQEAPYHLFGDFYSYEQKVVELRSFTDQTIELAKADPLTFRNVAGIVADQCHVYLPCLAEGSPENIHPTLGAGANNPHARWQYVIVEGIDGASFDYVKQKWDTVYWQDKDAVYIFDQQQLKKVAEADSASFEYLDFCFGKDKNHVFYYGQKLEIDAEHCKLDKHGFLNDNLNLYHYQHKLLLDAASFKVLRYESDVNPFLGTFILADKNGQYEYNRNWEKPLLKIE